MRIGKAAGKSRLIRRRERLGYLYVLPFVIGFFAFVFFPMLQSLVYSFHNLVLDGKLDLTFVGVENYKRAFLVDTDFRQMLLNAVGNMALNVPIILIFSMLVALFLNGKFAGRSFFQMVFFIPVIVSSGILPGLMAGDRVRASIINAASMTGDSVSMFNTTGMSDLLKSVNLPAEFVDYIMFAITNILEVINSSGIQILVFLIALKAIPRSLYEASEIEGATGWENFWKITFPMILPQMLVNLVYTIIDAFVSNTNAVMQAVKEYNFEKFQFGYAASLAWVYFGIVVLLLGVFSGILSRFIHHYE